MKYHLLLISLAIITFSCKEKTPEKVIEKTNTEHSNLKAALTLYASFDNGVDADMAKGDKMLYTVTSRKSTDSTQAGLHKKGVHIAKGSGRHGDALQYTEKSSGSIFYRSAQNIAYNNTDWSGAISFWLSLDPATDLEPGYCDPIQITDVSYNDAAIWVDFTKDNPRDFRLGVIGDRTVWNATPEGPDNENPSFLEQLNPVVKNPPFAKGKWTHILINFANLNTKNGQASLYMDSKLMGTRKNITDPFTWELEKSNIYLGLSYIGLMDELAIFNKALSTKEIHALYNLENGVQGILQ